MFDFDSVHFDEKVVIMLQKRNSIRRVLESLNSPKHGCFMRTFPIHGSRAHITGIGAQNALVASAMYYIVRIRIRYIPPPAPPCSCWTWRQLARVILKPHGFSYFERLYNTLFGGAPYALYFRFFKQFSRAGRDV